MAVSAAGGAVRGLAEATPVDRERVVDLLRAVAVLAVVAGHWLVVAVGVQQGGFTGVNVLEALPSTRPVTWVFQVMPVFFLVGGFANSASWAAHRRRGGRADPWVRGRVRRLVHPATVFILVLVSLTATARAVGVDPDLVRRAAWLAGISLWFLAVYLAVVALAPVMIELQARLGPAPVLLVLLSLVTAGDLARVLTGAPQPALANYLLVWLTVHQLGVAWHAGALTRSPGTPWLLAGGGLGAAVLLVGPGPYPVSMVGLPGAPLSNTDPPTLALLALGIGQTGLALLLRAPLERWARRDRPWAAVVAVNRVALTLYLWHLVPVLLATGLLVATGTLPDQAIGSAAWWWLRLPWLLLLTALALPVVVLLARFERPSTPHPTAPPGRMTSVLTATGVLASLLALTALAATGLTGLAPPVLGVPAAELVLLGTGLLLNHGVRRGWNAGRP